MKTVFNNNKILVLKILERDCSDLFYTAYARKYFFYFMYKILFYWDHVLIS